MNDPVRGAKARIVSQATLVFTLIEDEHGRTMDVRSFGSPEGDDDAEEFADALGAASLSIVEAAWAVEVEPGGDE